MRHSASRIAENTAYPMVALMGIVRNHAMTTERATDHRTHPAPFVRPTPMMAELIMWVVETGIPATEAAMMVADPEVSAANPWAGRSLVML